MKSVRTVRIEFDMERFWKESWCKVCIVKSNTDFLYGVNGEEENHDYIGNKKLRKNIWNR